MAFQAKDLRHKWNNDKLSDRLLQKQNELDQVREEEEIAWSTVEWQMRATADLQSTIDALETKRLHHGVCQRARCTQYVWESSTSDLRLTGLEKHGDSHETGRRDGVGTPPRKEHHPKPRLPGRH